MPADLSTLPSVDRLLNTETLRRAQDRHGRDRVVTAVREHLAALRAPTGPSLMPECDAIAMSISEMLDRTARPSLERVVNLTGTVLHTNLGRALLPRSAADALVRAATEPCNLEYDLEEGGRGERDAHVESTLCRLTGGQSALLVNNNAAALFLIINTLALRREVIVSRGELIEIGGQFRIPDILTRAGATLREVGTTNRTHLHDYADAMGPRTALLLKVHPSNYEIRGFTSDVPLGGLSALARERGLPLVHDLGSGTVLDLRRWGLPYEPTAQESLAAGADLVTFSGDKLLGGPQCGLVAGKGDLVARLRRNPLKRALRVDKLVIAALEDVLRLYADPDRLAEVLPTLRMLVRDVAEIETAARQLGRALSAELPPPYACEVVSCMSEIGSGALPTHTIPSAGVRIYCNAPVKQRNREIQRLQRALRSLPLPLLGRLEERSVVLDCRCLYDVAEVTAQCPALGRMLHNAQLAG